MDWLVHFPLWRLWMALGSWVGVSAVTTVLGRRLERLQPNNLVKSWLSEIGSDTKLYGRITAFILGVSFIAAYFYPVWGISWKLLQFTWLLFALLASIALTSAICDFADQWLQINESLTARDRRNYATLVPITASIVKIALYFLFFLMAMAIAGVNIAPLLGAGAVVSFVVGLAAQNILQDLFATLFIFTDRLFYVGTTIKLPGKKPGKVVKISARNTFVEIDNYLYIISNRNLDKFEVEK